MQPDVQNKGVGLLGDVDFLYTSDEKEAIDGSLSGSTATAEITGEEDGNNAMDVWTDYSLVASTEHD